jgi:hypothetical protein
MRHGAAPAMPATPALADQPYDLAALDVAVELS